MNDPILIWFLIGAFLILLEFVAPGFVVIFFGVGAVITSLACWLGLADAVPTQIMIFCISSLTCLFGMRKYVKRWFVGESNIKEGDIYSIFVGQSVKVVIGIPGGAARGKVELNGSDWNAISAEPHEAGDMVTIIERSGLILVVK